VDTPGLKEFGIWEPSREELQSAFPEFATVEEACRFPDCSHTHEPDCAIQAAVEMAVIDGGRYASYAKILEEVE
jgi:ribosome biogenesis GTPase